MMTKKIILFASILCCQQISAANVSGKKEQTSHSSASKNEAKTYSKKVVSYLLAAIPVYFLTYYIYDVLGSPYNADFFFWEVKGWNVGYTEAINYTFLIAILLFPLFYMPIFLLVDYLLPEGESKKTKESGLDTDKNT